MDTPKIATPRKLVDGGTFVTSIPAYFILYARGGTIPNRAQVDRTKGY